jgi:NADPH-dependent 2,4-dienoyl-CoA reductase/sulfur reductase-like enzyme
LICAVTKEGRELWKKGLAYDYHLLVIGSGPAGRLAALEASKCGKRVAVADR